MRSLYSGVSETQFLSGMNGAAACAKKFLISVAPAYVFPPAVNVASGAHSVIIRPTFFVDDAWCHFTSICAMSAFAAVSSSERDAALLLEPQAAMAITAVRT